MYSPQPKRIEAIATPVPANIATQNALVRFRYSAHCFSYSSTPAFMSSGGFRDSTAASLDLA